MTAVRLHRPTTIAEAVALLADYGDGAMVVAGGTAVTIMLRQGLIAPDALISIGMIDGLDSIDATEAQLVLGALVRHRTVEMNPLVRTRLPLLAEAFGEVACVRIRNAATVGGVVAEADYASDPPAVLTVLDAVVDVAGPNGPRSIPIREFILSFYESALEPGEIVTAVRVPLLPAGSGGAYEKFVTRSSEDRPCIGVAAVVRLDGDGVCEDLRVGIGAVSEVPVRFPDVERTGLGQRMDVDVAASIADAYADLIDPIDDMRGSAWYRTQMIRVWVRRALERARLNATGAAP